LGEYNKLIKGNKNKKKEMSVYEKKNDDANVRSTFGGREYKFCICC
jgi:hypothetical protein